MTKAELIAKLEPFPDDMEVRYRYDSGYDHPKIVAVYMHEDECGRNYGQFICLDEDPQ